MQWFSIICISQRSVAARLRCGGIFNNHFTANFLESVTVEDFLKSINIWRRYWQKLVCTFLWPTVCVVFMRSACSRVAQWNRNTQFYHRTNDATYLQRSKMTTFHWTQRRSYCWLSKIVTYYFYICRVAQKGHFVLRLVILEVLSRSARNLAQINVISCLTLPYYKQLWKIEWRIVSMVSFSIRKVTNRKRMHVSQEYYVNTDSLKI